MKDISIVIKNLLGGVDAKEVRKVATVVVDAMSRVCGEKYVLMPASSLSTEQAKKGVKRPKRWAKTITGIDYTAKPNGYAIKGEFANVWDLLKEPNGAYLMVSVPGYGLMLGYVSHSRNFTGQWESGKEFEIKGFVETNTFDEGDYAALIAVCKDIDGIEQAA